MSTAPPNPPPGDSDAQLVQRAATGDQRAFELLVIKYQRRLQRLIGRMVRDSDLVEDIAQETFIRAYRALSQFRGESQFYTWLYRIAVNTTKKFLQERKLFLMHANSSTTRVNHVPNRDRQRIIFFAHHHFDKLHQLRDGLTLQAR